MATYQLVDIDVWPEKSVPIDQSARLANGAQQIRLSYFLPSDELPDIHGRLEMFPLGNAP
jgi:hypothetical protein